MKANPGCFTLQYRCIQVWLLSARQALIAGDPGQQRMDIDDLRNNCELHGGYHEGGHRGLPPLSLPLMVAAAAEASLLTAELACAG